MPIKVTLKADAQDKMEKIGKAKKKARPTAIGVQPANKVEKVEGMMTGGMCRGMGAAIKGGKFEGVK
jgi:hypothetical protein